MQAGFHETRPGGPGMLPQQWWEGGLYKNEYVEEGGVWKIRVCGNVCVFQGTFEQGWAHAPREDSNGRTRCCLRRARFSGRRPTCCLSTMRIP
jgi:hypothetical protein